MMEEVERALCDGPADAEAEEEVEVRRREAQDFWERPVEVVLLM